MTTFKDALTSLSPLPFDDLPSQGDLPQFLKDAFAHAECVLNSVPVQSSDSSSSFTPAAANTAHSAEETFCDPTTVPLPAYERDPDGTKAWGKPLKLSQKENPLGVQVFKMAAHDRHGAWFGRRSVHQGIGFEKWRKAASQEFVESLKVQEGPGSGAVRGVAADRRVEKIKASDDSTIEVWQTSSAFPGPVTPRESLTLLLSSTNALTQEIDSSNSGDSTDLQHGGPRHFLVISRPTRHSDAPNRANLVKMEYESVEMVREIPLKNSEDPESNPLEWLMVTRSDPGGGIPKFMVERGTPGSIVADVAKFLNWACRKSETDLDQADEDDIDAAVEEQNKKADTLEEKESREDEHGQTTAISLTKPVDYASPEQAQQYDGLVSKFTEAVGTTVSGYLPYFQSQTALATAERDDSDLSSDISESSGGTFRSALHEQTKSPTGALNDLPNESNASFESSSAREGEPKHARNQSRELDKLLEKRAALDARARKEREEYAQKAAQASEKEEKERSKMLDKHEKQRKKQEERYHRELAKLDARRLKEERKDEDRRKKAEAKDELKRLKSEVSEWKNRCQVAEKEADLLRQQVESLQRENTAIVARLPEGEAKSLLHETGRSRTSSSKPGSTKSNVS